MQTKVYNIFEAPKPIDSPHGEHIYEWDYLDEKGIVQHDKKNVHEEIQSYISRVDYKSQIKRGELELNADLGTDSKDYRTIPDNTVDIYKYLTYLSSIPKDQVTKLLEQFGKTSENGVQTTQASNQAGTTAGQAPAQNSGNQPTVGASPTNITEGVK